METVHARICIDHKQHGGCETLHQLLPSPPLKIQTNNPLCDEGPDESQGHGAWGNVKRPPGRLLYTNTHVEIILNIKPVPCSPRSQRFGLISVINNYCVYMQAN